MATLVIGDFRTNQLKQCQEKLDDASINYTYLYENNAEYSWFSTSALAQIPLMSLSQANVVIMLGFNDCVYSCTWDTFNIDKIAANYANTINDLIKQYKNFNFYVCSLCPIDYPFPFSAHKDGTITIDALDKKIKRFNSILQETCSATFLDCYNYVSSTAFNTYDGVRYDIDTSRSLLYYIQANMKPLGGVFIQRTKAPKYDKKNPAESDRYWLSYKYDGPNYFNPQSENIRYPGDTLPNCTAYAWGRFYEILGKTPKLSTGNARSWWGHTSDKYERGNTPRVGAVICWGSAAGNKYGHVAIVEQVNPNGSIVTSESSWKGFYWKRRTRTNKNGNWGESLNYNKFQGFIYCPVTSGLVTKDNICTKNSYNISSEEMRINAQYIWQYLRARGWSINAVAALLGNLQQESKMSPCIWEGTISGSTINSDGTQSLNMDAINTYYRNKNRYPGYGLVQWTPYSKYTNWCKENKLSYWDIDSQLKRIEWEAENNVQWISRPSKGYDLSFKEFITSTQDASWLAAAFAFCYERPARSSGTIAEQDALRKERGEYGKDWYNYLSNLSFIGVDTTLRVNDFKICNCTSTAATATFLVKNGKKASYKLIHGEELLQEKSLVLSSDLVSFDLTSLVPNKEYTIELIVTGSNSKKISETITFRTLQDFPKAITTVELIPMDTKLPNNTFKLKTDILSSKDWGYWKNNKHGYTIQLIVNGKSVDTKQVSTLAENWTFSIDKDFSKYKSKLGDSVQISIYPWVTDDNKNKIFDKYSIKMSNTVCFLKKPVLMYLKK